jgi:hypothetical protein
LRRRTFLRMHAVDIKFGGLHLITTIYFVLQLIERILTSDSANDATETRAGSAPDTAVYCTVNDAVYTRLVHLERTGFVLVTSETLGL